MKKPSSAAPVANKQSNTSPSSEELASFERLVEILRRHISKLNSEEVEIQKNFRSIKTREQYEKSIQVFSTKIKEQLTVWPTFTYAIVQLPTVVKVTKAQTLEYDRLRSKVKGLPKLNFGK